MKLKHRNKVPKVILAVFVEFICKNGGVLKFFFQFVRPRHYEMVDEMKFSTSCRKILFMKTFLISHKMEISHFSKKKKNFSKPAATSLPRRPHHKIFYFFTKCKLFIFSDYISFFTFFFVV